MMKIVIFAMIAIAAFASIDTDEIVPEFQHITLTKENQGEQNEFPEDEFPEELVDEDEFATPEVSCDPNKAKREANTKLANALTSAIAFKPNSAKISSISEKTLMKVADTLHQFPWLEVDIIGQSSLGKGKYCTELTTNRAKSVIDYMTGKGIKNKLNAKSQCKAKLAVKMVAAGGSSPIPHAAIKKCKKEKEEKKTKEVADKKAEQVSKAEEKKRLKEEKEKSDKAKAAAKEAKEKKEKANKKEKKEKKKEKATKEAAEKKEVNDKEKVKKAKDKESKEKAKEAAKKHEKADKEKVAKAEVKTKEAAQKKAEAASKAAAKEAAEKKSKEHTQKKSCNRDTGGTCRVMNCWSSRGQTDCKKYSFWTYKCLCKYGSCPKNGRCYDAITGRFTRL